MTYIRLQSSDRNGRPVTVHVLDGDTTACGRATNDATVVGSSGKVGMCSSCLRVQSIRGTMTDAWKEGRKVNRMALIRELVEIRAKRGEDDHG